MADWRSHRDGLRVRAHVRQRELARVLQAAEQTVQRTPAAAAASEFERLLGEAIARLPAALRAKLESMPLLISARGAELAAYGYQHGEVVPRPDGGHALVLYRDTLERDFGHDPALLADRIEQTLHGELEPPANSRP